MNSVARFFVCACCRKQTVICSTCDRGQIYCSRDCAQSARNSSARESGRRYQSSERGRLAHVQRMRRYRAKQEEVTHQGSYPPLPDALLMLGTTPIIKAAVPVFAPCIPSWHCRSCRLRCSEFVRLGLLRGHPNPRHSGCRLRRSDSRGHSPCHGGSVLRLGA
jgi:hypothetical protein